MGITLQCAHISESIETTTEDVLSRGTSHGFSGKNGCFMSHRIRKNLRHIWHISDNERTIVLNVYQRLFAMNNKTKD